MQIKVTNGARELMADWPAVPSVGDLVEFQEGGGGIVAAITWRVGDPVPTVFLRPPG